jgi:putative phosphoribosyl transferase
MAPHEALVHIPAGRVQLEGQVVIPAGATGIVAFAHGSGSSRHSPRNQFVAGVLNGGGIATFLFDLLTREEDVEYATRFDIALLTRRLTTASGWLMKQPDTKALNLGFFGASTGAAAAVQAAAALGDKVKAVVSRGGRPDLAGEQSLAAVRAPTLLIVGGNDLSVIDLNENAYAQLTCTKHLQIIPGATHLFEEPGTLEAAASAAGDWFARYLTAD